MKVYWFKQKSTRKYGTPTRNIFRRAKQTNNPVTKSVSRDILIKRIEAGDIYD